MYCNMHGNTYEIAVALICYKVSKIKPEMIESYWIVQTLKFGCGQSVNIEINHKVCVAFDKVYKSVANASSGDTFTLNKFFDSDHSLIEQQLYLFAPLFNLVNNRLEFLA